MKKLGLCLLTILSILVVGTTPAAAQIEGRIIDISNTEFKMPRDMIVSIIRTDENREPVGRAIELVLCEEDEGNIVSSTGIGCVNKDGYFALDHTLTGRPLDDGSYRVGIFYRDHYATSLITVQNGSAGYVELLLQPTGIDARMKLGFDAKGKLIVVPQLALHEEWWGFDSQLTVPLTIRVSLTGPSWNDTSSPIGRGYEYDLTFRPGWTRLGNHPFVLPQYFFEGWVRGQICATFQVVDRNYPSWKYAEVKSCIDTPLLRAQK